MIIFHIPNTTRESSLRRMMSKKIRKALSDEK